MTTHVDDLMTTNYEFAWHVRWSLRRHLVGDWGEICDEDRVTNKLALQKGARLFPAYKRGRFPTIWVIMEGDRSVTTMLFPEEY